MLKRIGIFICVFTLLFSAAALAEAPKKGGTLVFGRGGDSVGLDPAYETDGNSFMVCDNIFEALVAYKEESTALEPGKDFLPQTLPGAWVSRFPGRDRLSRRTLIGSGFDILVNGGDDPNPFFGHIIGGKSSLNDRTAGGCGDSR